jgi:hypothetical protein
MVPHAVERKNALRLFERKEERIIFGNEKEKVTGA